MVRATSEDMDGVVQDVFAEQRFERAAVYYIAAAVEDLVNVEFQSGVRKDANGAVVSAAFVYSWDRWLDGPDLHDQDTPEENPGACVVTALDQGLASWLIVTNGKLWRLYSRQAHARATNQ